MSSTALPSPPRFGKTSPKLPTPAPIEAPKSTSSRPIVPTTANPAQSVFGTAVASSTAESLPEFLRLELLTLLPGNLKECSFYFIPKVLAAAIQQGRSKDEIKSYLQSFSCKDVERSISNRIIQGHSVIFYAAKRAAVDIMELLLDRKRPLVLAFAGLSGHGKTEVATSLGYLLGTDMRNVDMSKTHSVTSLFGAAAPYQNHDKGSPSNNYLASHTGERCVVFLDEFDKTTQAVRESLLTILDSGTGMDLRSNTVTNVTKWIWILASNKGDSLIPRFYNENLRGKDERERRHVSIKPLENDLRKLLVKTYTPAVTGRISSFLPFFPFSLEEAAVINHKFLRSLGDQLRLPIDLHSKPPRPIDHLHLSLLEDGELCKFLAENYIQELGARSIQNGIDNLADYLFMHYTVPVDEITEATNSKPHVKYTMSLRSAADNVEIVIYQDGTTLNPSD
ncbi:P-loop containing nucleoside triphosphate hydrolase protein, partial [Aureobasidium melanogenum]